MNLLFKKFRLIALIFHLYGETHVNNGYLIYTVDWINDGVSC